MTFLFRYSGKFEGDTLTGTVERPTPPEGERKEARMESHAKQITNARPIPPPMKSLRHLLFFFAFVSGALAAETKPDATGLLALDRQRAAGTPGNKGPARVQRRGRDRRDYLSRKRTADLRRHLQDGSVNFVVIREVQGEKLRVKYSGKLDGDTLTGTIDRPQCPRAATNTRWSSGSTRAK